MPSFVIHLAIAKEYLKINKEENEEDFLKGVIQPDFVAPKSLSHYGKSPIYTNLKKFLENNNIDSSYNRGIFMHLVSDYLFYNKYITKLPEGGLYSDYDIINKDLKEKYNINIPEEVKPFAKFIKGNTKVLHLELAMKVIEEICILDLDKVKEEVLNNEIKWSSFVD